MNRLKGGAYLLMVLQQLSTGTRQGSTVYWDTAGISMGTITERESDVGCCIQHTASFLVIAS